MVKIFCQYDCDVFDPNCYAFYRLNLNNYHRSDQPKSNRCNQQSVWLIPGRADATCSKLSSFPSFTYFAQFKTTETKSSLSY